MIYMPTFGSVGLRSNIGPFMGSVVKFWLHSKIYEIRELPITSENIVREPWRIWFHFFLIRMVLCLELYNDRSTLERFTKLLSPLFSLGPWIYRALMCRKLEIMKGNSSMAVNWWYWCELEVSYMVFAVLYHALSNLRFLWFFFRFIIQVHAAMTKQGNMKVPVFLLK